MLRHPASRNVAGGFNVIPTLDLDVRARATKKSAGYPSTGHLMIGAA